MAGTPRYKVYRDNEYVAACKYPEDAAIIIAAGIGGDNQTIRDGHKKIVWSEGSESQFAHESYDFVVATIYSRL